VDFVLKKDQQLLPIEVKSSWQPPIVPPGLRHFLSYYPESKNAVVLYDGPEYTSRYNDCTIYFAPIHKAFAALSLL